MSDAEASMFVTKKACYEDLRIKWPQNDLPPPVEDKPIRQLTLFDRPETVPNTIIVHNYCNYDIHFTHINQVKTLDNGILKAGETYTSPLSTLPGGVWKGSKAYDMSKVVLAEYSIVQATNDLWYNLSLVKCLGVTNGQYTTDTNACAGHEAGLQFGNKQSKSYQCASGLWCDDQAYLYDVS
jgi:hypothetical protein